MVDLHDELPEGTVLADGFDAAFCGLTHDGRAVYDIDKIVDICIIDWKMTADEAMEYFEYNMAFAYVGEKTPIYVFLYNTNQNNTKMGCNKGKNKGSKKKGGKR